jgi:hypothetical protein
LTSRLVGSRTLPRSGLAAAIGAAVTAGLALGWAAAGPSLALAGLAILLAAANGYGKAYSP